MDANQTSTATRISVASFYKFVPLSNRRELKHSLEAHGQRLEILGTILLAPEGINGSLAGEPNQLRSMIETLHADQRFSDLVIKHSTSEGPPFHRFRVRLKKEIVTLGVEELKTLDPTAVGTYVKPEDWNQLISDPQVVVVDARNDYETAIGRFEGAVDPETASFGELPDWLNTYEPLQSKPPVAMYCTGGIRCEKATALLRARGFDKVFHLEGGILAYLETIPDDQSSWQGECFVFDHRVSLGPGLEPGIHELCHACGWPVDPTDRESPFFRPGVSCPRCHGTWSEQQLDTFASRQRQVELAGSTDSKHLGQVLPHEPDDTST